MAGGSGLGPAVIDRRYRPGLPDFTRQENWIRGNRRTVRRQYAARNWTFVRVLPGIAGYCRVVGPVEIRSRLWCSFAQHKLWGWAAWGRLGPLRQLRSSDPPSLKLWRTSCGVRSCGQNQRKWLISRICGGEIQIVSREGREGRKGHPPPQGFRRRPPGYGGQDGATRARLGFGAKPAKGQFSDTPARSSLRNRFS